MHVNMKIETARVPTRFLITNQDAYKIILDLQYTEEEKYLIENLGIQNHIVFTTERLQSDELGSHIEYKVGDFCKTRLQNRHPLFDDNPTYALLIDAKAAIPVIEESFRALKQMLDTADIPKHRTFEL
jgi:hypothetical protein